MSYFVRRNAIDPIHDFVAEAPPARLDDEPSPLPQTLQPRDPSLRALKNATEGRVDKRRDIARVWPELLCLWS